LEPCFPERRASASSPSARWSELFGGTMAASGCVVEDRGHRHDHDYWHHG
jgi:hypothetical protein